MSADGISRIEPVKCLWCGHRVNAVGPLSPAPAMPAPGDPVLCIRCGAVQTWEAGRLRGFTDAEMNALTADAEQMNELARHVRRIRVIRAERN